MNHPKNENIADILWKRLKDGVLEIEEKELLDQWLSESVYNREVFREITDEEKWNNELKLLLKRDSQVTWNTILLAIEEKQEVKEAEVIKVRRPWLRYAAAAVLISMLGGGVYRYWNHHSTPKDIATVKPVKNSIRDAAEDILPGGFRATFTSGDGIVADMEKMQGSSIINKGYSKITNNLKDGELVFDAAGSRSSDNQIPKTLNTLSTPRGGLYKVVLPDGSRIWLNAASTLRFPTSFSSKERSVELTGEAYFEVKPVNSFLAGNHPGAGSGVVPFYVKINGVNIKVLSTRFNVKAYTNDDHKVTTTLEEGAVIVNKGDQFCQLKPGEQARVSSDEEYPVKPIHNEPVKDIKAAGLWKSGYFSFNKVSIDEVMREVSRWYNIEVVYKGPKPRRLYTGSVNRTISITGIIKMLQHNGVNAKVDGNKLVLSLQ